MAEGIGIGEEEMSFSREVEEENREFEPEDRYDILSGGRFAEGQMYSRADAEQAPLYEEPVVTYLDLENHPMLTKRELWYIAAVSRGVSVKTEPGFVLSYKDKDTATPLCYEGPTTSLQAGRVTEEMIRALRYPTTDEGYTESRDFEAFMGAMLHSKNKDEGQPSQDILMRGTGTLLRGNVIETILEGKSSCLDFSIGAALMAKTQFTRSIGEPALLPYSFRKTANKARTLLGHEHYGMFFKKPDGSEHIMMNGGLAIPVEVLLDTSQKQVREDGKMDRHKRARDWLNANIRPDVAEVDKKDDVEYSLVHFLAMARSMKELKKSGYIRTNADQEMIEAERPREEPPDPVDEFL